jgi:hypothetical protein
MASTRGRLLVLGGNPLHGSDALDSRMRACLWDLSLGQRTGDGRFDGEVFLGGLLIFHIFGWVVDFFGGAGEGKRNTRARLPRRFRRTTRVQNNPVYVIYYILCSGSFAAAFVRQSRTVSPILDALDRHVRCSSFDNPST